METTTTQPKQKKATIATIKSFVNKNRATLFINVKETRQGGEAVSVNEGFKKPLIENTPDQPTEWTMGIQGAWFVGSSRDYISPYEDSAYKGYAISNSCAAFILAIPKQEATGAASVILKFVNNKILLLHSDGTELASKEATFQGWDNLFTLIKNNLK